MIVARTAIGDFVSQEDWSSRCDRHRALDKEIMVQELSGNAIVSSSNRVYQRLRRDLWRLEKFVVSGAGRSVRCRRSNTKIPAKITI